MTNNHISQEELDELDDQIAAIEHYKQLDGTEDDDAGDEDEGVEQNDAESDPFMNPFHNAVQQSKVNSLLVSPKINIDNPDLFDPPKIDFEVIKELDKQLGVITITNDVTQQPDSSAIDMDTAQQPDSPKIKTDVLKLYHPPLWNDERYMQACRYRAAGLNQAETTHLIVKSLSNGGSSESIGDIPDFESQLKVEIDRIYLNTPLIPQKTDSGLADYCRLSLSNRVEYCSDRKKFVYWDSDQWHFDESDHHLSMLVDRLILVIPNAIDDPKQKSDYEYFVGRAGTTASVVRILKRRFKQVKSAEFDAKPNLLSVQNGVVDLETLTFRAHSMEDYLTKRANVMYDADASCPVFDQFIDQILCHDSELITYVKTFLGYLLIGKNPERMIFFLLGNGRNGKSTLILVLQRMFGSYARSMPVKTLLNSGYLGTGDDLMSMVGYRLLVTSELEANDILAAGKLKSISGKDVVSARKLYDVYTDISIDGKMVISTNEKPQVKDKSEGIWDRLQIIPFEYRVPEEQVDPLLTEKLLEETAGILNWMLKGLKLYRDHGFKETRQMKSLKAQYRLDSDPVRAFMDEYYDKSEKQFVRTAVVFRNFKDWCRNQYYKSAQLTQKKFNDEVIRIGFEFK
jgi:putative DNA primase/helicase